MKKLFNRKSFPYILYILVSILFLSPILIHAGLPFKYDWSWPLFDTGWFFSQFINFQITSVFSVFGMYYGLLLSLLSIIRNPEISFCLFILAIPFFSASGFYILLKNRLRNRLLAILIPIIYAFSPYIFIRMIVGFQSSMIAYAALPFFYFFYLNEKSFTWKKGFLAALMLSLIFSQSQSGVLVSLTLLMLLLVSIPYKRFRLEIKKVFKLLACYVVLNLPFLALALGQQGQIETYSGGDVTTLKYIGNLPHSLRNVLMLSDHQITQQFFYPLAREKFLLIGYLFFLLVVLLSILNKKYRFYFWFLGLTALMVIPFSIGPTGKFSAFYSWVFNHFPKIALFRETYHFEFILAFIFIFLFAFGADQLVTWLSSHTKVLKAGAWSLVVASLGLFVIAPFLTLDFANYLNMQEIPHDYNEFAKYLKDSSTCQKIYYPPNLGFIYFKEAGGFDAANSDLLALFTAVPYVTEGSSILNVASEEMFERNLLTSIYLNKTDNGQFVAEFAKSDADCLVVRDDLDTKYSQASNLWREQDYLVRAKWFQSDMLGLARSKVGLEEVKRFGNRIYIFKDTRYKKQDTNNSQISITNNQVGSSRPPTTDDRLTNLPITGAAKEFDYYKDGWSRGRYTFWRKELFAQLKQDFIYTDKQDSVLTGKIDQTGNYDLWTRYLTGGTPGEINFGLGTRDFGLSKDSGEEKFVWKDLGEVNVSENDQISIKNISGENAIADLVLVSK